MKLINLIYPVAPIEVLNSDEAKNVPSFHRVFEARICYFCRFNKYTGFENFQCEKHGIVFGDKTSLQVEFTCDDWNGEV